MQSSTAKELSTVVAKPILKWAGGKTQILSELLHKVPSSSGRYNEPYIGGGALFFALQPEKAIIADSNPELINMYRQVAEHVDDVISYLKKYENTSEMFYSVRSLDWETLPKAEAAARTIYLNKTCYNGLYRVNKKGQFNVPYGKYKNPKICDAEALWAASETLKKADIICGDVNPSGKLADTIPDSYDSYQNAREFLTGFEHLDYFDDIYVGYRYFETIPGAAEKVRYPFGFGLSYTDFEFSGAFCGESDGKIVAAVTVKNIGKVPGKEVVQLYYSAPQGKLGKPAKELAAFKKTKLLSPGESEAIALSFDIGDMASFDDLGKIKKSAFVLEKGTYSFYLGNSVRETEKLRYDFVLSEDIITKESKPLCRPFKLEKRLLADGSFENLPTGEPVYTRGTHAPIEATAPKDTIMFDEVGENITLDEFIKQFTVDELIDFVGGHQNQPGVCNTGAFGGMKRLDVPPVPTADGPAGLRLNASTGVPTTAWPCATLLACTWNTDLIEEVGAAGGAELRENNLGVWLAPAMNIHRNPLCGRNFEYFSEDPLLAGKCCAADVRGIQSQKIAASVKHFACNNRESNRFECDSRVSERALREIYLRGFEICVKEADPWTIMSSYNLINGCHTSVSYELLTEMLRNEWGFKGMVTTDWGVHSSHSDEVLAGNDVKMGDGEPEELKAAFENGKITRADLETSVRRILELTMKVAE